MLGKQSKFTAAAKRRVQKLTDKKERADRYNMWMEGGASDISDTETKEFASASAGRSPAPKWSPQDESELRSLKRRFERQRNSDSDSDTCGYYAIDKRDLNIIGHEASYRDLIRKTVAEARSMRARQAWARWIEEGGQPYGSDGRIRTRQQVLALVPPEHVPLPPFCYAKQLSVEAVLDEMGIKDNADLPSVRKEGA